MSNLHEPPAATLAEAILQLEEPVVFRNLLCDSDGKKSWKFLEWNLTELSQQLDNLKLLFRIGVNAKTSEPQWDFKCKVKSMTMGEFLQNVKSSSENSEWYYFDYKYMHEWFHDHPEILSSIDWQRFGFDKQGTDSTLWIGTKGAHTNCHQDSYGCNLVAQMHGRKRWILFPPDSSLILRPTRIPYEESTVYSSFNLFCPSKSEEEAMIKSDPKARMVILEPGEVLLVPSGWWHYVESMDLSISVNVWLQIATDCRSRLGESVVKLLVKEIGRGLISTSDKSPVSSDEAMNLVQTCIEQCYKTEPTTSPSRKKLKIIRWTATKLVSEYSDHVCLLPLLEPKELQQLLSENRNRFPDVECQYAEPESPSSSCSERSNSCKQTTNILINALCHPEVIAKVTELLLESSHLQ